MQEKYIQCRDFPNYSVSSNGNVKNIKTLRVLKFGHSKGYRTVHPSIKGVSKTITVHKLVALEFCEKGEGDQVNHIDGNKLNNCSTNLEWVTALQNMEHAVANNLHKTIKSRRLDDMQLLTMLTLAGKRGNRKACREYNCSADFLSRVRRGRVYKHLAEIARSLYGK